MTTLASAGPSPFVASNFSAFTFVSSPTPGVGNAWVMLDTDGTLNNANSGVGATLPMLASEYQTTIQNPHQLQLMVLAPAANYTLGRSIDASATGNSSDIWDIAGFIPVAPAFVGPDAELYFGTFNGLPATRSRT